MRGQSKYKQIAYQKNWINSGLKFKLQKQNEEKGQDYVVNGVVIESVSDKAGGLAGWAQVPESKSISLILMYSIVTIVNNTILYRWDLLRE